MTTVHFVLGVVLVVVGVAFIVGRLKIVAWQRSRASGRSESPNFFITIGIAFVLGGTLQISVALR